jgi:protocatechuate 3,4-dioxygenase beta subunit
MAVYLRRKALILDRRALLIGAGALAAAPAIARAELAVTPAQMEGPFYPRIKPIDSDADLTLIKGGTGRAKGEAIELTGRVLSAKGGPVPNAVVELWQADANGRYHHVRDGLQNERDPNFQGYGAVKTDAQGNWRFRTVKPRYYEIGGGENRTPHIHFKVRPPEGSELTTQMYFPDEAMNAGDFLYEELGSDAARAAATATAEGERLRWDIVLG